MARALYLFIPLDIRLLEEVIEAHVQNFEEELKDIFSDDELDRFHRELEEMAPYSLSLRPAELRFEDFDTDQSSDEKRNLFERAKTSVVLENLPFLETNPFQVSSIRSLLERLPEILIDEEGLGDLLSKGEYLHKISGLKGLEIFLNTPSTAPIKEIRKQFIPVDPIDFLVQDVYQARDRVLSENLLEKALLGLQTEKDSVKDLFFIVRESRLSPSELFKRSGLGAKDFDDDLEKLKFFLRKLLQ